MSFAQSDLVVCVSTHPIPDRQPNPWTLKRLREGAYYRVAAYFPNRGTPGLALAGIDHSPGRGWHAWRFRKITGADPAFCKVLQALCREPV